MIDFELIEAGKLVQEIQENLFQHPEIFNIWLDYETEEVVMVMSDNSMEYVLSIDEFLRVKLPRH